MEIHAFKKRQRQMELEIGDAVQKAMAKFREETGYSPHMIEVRLVCANTIGHPYDHYVLEDVDAEVSI